MNTIEEQASVGRRRRQYSKEFKARAVADCQGRGVSIAAIALHHQLNANLLRRWVEQAEGRTEGRPPGQIEIGATGADGVVRGGAVSSKWSEHICGHGNSRRGAPR